MVFNLKEVNINVVFALLAVAAVILFLLTMNKESFTPEEEYPTQLTQDRPLIRLPEYETLEEEALTPGEEELPGLIKRYSPAEYTKEGCPDYIGYPEILQHKVLDPSKYEEEKLKMSHMYKGTEFDPKPLGSFK